MMKELKDEYSHILHIRCLAHLLHNAVTKAVSESPVVSVATEFSVNLSRMLRGSGTVQASWSAEVKSRQLLDPRRVPKYYDTRWESLLTVLQFALDYLPGSVSFVRQVLVPATPVQEKLVEMCSGSNESGVLALLRTKLVATIHELQRLQAFLDTMQLKKTTFGTMTKGIALLEDNLRQSAAADEESITSGFPSEFADLLEPYASVVIDSVKQFRSVVNRHFQESLTKHFYRDVRVSQLGDCAQLLDARLPTRQQIAWSRIEFAANWWSTTAANPAAALESIQAEYERYKRMELPTVTDALATWEMEVYAILQTLPPIFWRYPLDRRK
jgi:hypothetical protein